MFVNVANGKPCGQWLSYACEHPFLSTLQFHSEDVAKASKDVLDTTKTALEVIQLLQKLNEGERR